MRKYFILGLFMLSAVSTLMAQNVEAVGPEAGQTAEKHRYWSAGVTGGLDRNYHIVDMSYMNDYHYSKFAEGSSYGLQLGFSPLRWLTLRVDGVMIQKNYYRDHVIARMNASLPDTTCNQYLNIPVVLMLNVGKTVRLHAFGRK